MHLYFLENPSQHVQVLDTWRFETLGKFFDAPPTLVFIFTRVKINTSAWLNTYVKKYKQRYKKKPKCPPLGVNIETE